MNQVTRQEILLSLLKVIKDQDPEIKKQLANDLYMSVSELDDLLYELIRERSFYGKTRTF
jgi:hypothetical protein